MEGSAVSRSTQPPWIAVGPMDAPAIVFLHGTRMTRTQWYPHLRRLGTRYRCVAVDLPGHGRRADEPFTIEGVVAAVDEAIAAEVPAGRAVIAGLSLGGYMAIEVADARPDLVQGLILAGCSADAVGPVSRPFAFLASILEHVSTPTFERLNRWFFRVRFPRSTSEPIIEGGFWPRAGAAGIRLVTGRRYLERLGRLWTPVLVVNGSLDPVFAPQGDYWAASCRKGRHVILAHATNLSSLDRPTAFSRQVARFADEIARAG
jgi:pimeloyl-ACP methyl ester carboxylesterase